MVSIVIPTKNSAAFLESCLKSIINQSYGNIEILLVDSDSTDDTHKIAKKYNSKIFYYSPKVPKGTFDAPHKRNFGADKANGDFIYYVDADMELSKNVVRECVELCKKQGFDAVIIHEDSVGDGIWASAKNLERRTIWGDDTQEAPRFLKKTVWDEIGGLDTSLGGGGDDWDLYEKLKDNNYKVGRIKSLVLHNEGKLTLKKLIKKRFMYGRDSVKYIKKRPKAAVYSYFPIRKCYIINWRMFLKRPIDALFFIIMKSSEYFAAGVGVVYSYVIKDG